jgi:hypothetical protein
MGNRINKSIKELCRIFVEKGKQGPNWIINNIVAFLMEYKDGYDRREISSGSTIRNYIKVVKLICKMNDIVIHWKRSHEAFQMEGSGLMLELQALRKYESYEYSNRNIRNCAISPVISPLIRQESANE